MDVYCRICREPVDMSHLREEYTAEERRKFMNGEGCDSCNWGTCPTCHGGTLAKLAAQAAGREPPICPTCNGTGRMKPVMDGYDFDEAIDAASV
jgi:DnaJ-class molecular chaperone